MANVKVQDAMENRVSRILRQRDFIAAICAVILVRLSYTFSRGSESLTATIDLTFYTDFTSHINKDHLDTRYDYKIAKPVPFDVDGDGRIEAIVVASKLEQSNPTGKEEHTSTRTHTHSQAAKWGLKVLDLKPLHPPNSLSEENLPFYPDVIFTTNDDADDVDDDSNPATDRVPVKMVTGQVILRDRRSGENQKRDSNPSEHYYCGITWHEANTMCSVPCPSGSKEDCPIGQSCFADTSCREYSSSKKRKESSYAKNLNDGLPSVATIWSNGDVSLHSITAQDETSNLQLVEMWNVNQFDHRGTDTNWIDFIEVGLLLESDAPVGQYGALVVAVRYYTHGANEMDGGNNSDESSLYFALDAFSGEILWKNDAHHRHHSNRDAQGMDHTIEDTYSEQQPQVHMPLSSTGRRRSRLSQYTKNVIKTDESESSEDCQHHFRKLILEESSGVLPHAFWHQGVQRGSIEFDTKLMSSHFDRKHQYKRIQNHHPNSNRAKPGWLVKAITDAGKRKVKQQRNSSLRYGNPNVVAFHNRHGINILSLKNGKQVCHLSLLENVFYADVNQDGIVDQIQVVTKNAHTQDEEGAKPIPVCQALVHSGITIKDEIVSIPLCNGKNNKPHPGVDTRSNLSAAPPLLVESVDGFGNMEYDMVYAINNGLIKRFDMQGRALWTGRGPLADVPGWDEIHGMNNGYLDRINFEDILASSKIMLGMRPILLSGDSKLSIFTSGGGRLLDKASFPQMIVGRPILADLNGDGTTDVLVTTIDGIWGYCVTVATGSSKFLKIMNSFLGLFVTFTFFVGYFDGPGHEMQRSTDP